MKRIAVLVLCSLCSVAVFADHASASSEKASMPKPTSVSRLDSLVPTISPIEAKQKKDDSEMAGRRRRCRRHGGCC